MIHGEIVGRSAGEGTTAETRPIDSMNDHVAFYFEWWKISLRIVIKATTGDHANSRAACYVESEIRENLTRGGMIRKKSGSRK